MSSTSRLLNGRTVILAAFRQQPDLQDGDQLIWSLRDGALMATTRRAQLGKAQALFQKLLPQCTVSMADELIAERRAASNGE